MFIVIVKIEVDSENERMFNMAAKKQAEVSLDREKGCLKFDICTDPRRRSNFLLMQEYHSNDAYDLHLMSDHHMTFDQITAPWVAMKSIEMWEKELPLLRD